MSHPSEPQPTGRPERYSRSDPKKWNNATYWKTKGQNFSAKPTFQDIAESEKRTLDRIKAIDQSAKSDLARAIKIADRLIKGNTPPNPQNKLLLPYCDLEDAKTLMRALCCKLI